VNRYVSLFVGLILLVALDALVIGTARAFDPGAPVIFMSNLAAVFIGGIQLLYGVPLALWLRRRRPEVARGIGIGMALVLTLNVIALYG
jgi:hypothetical protein